MPTPMPPAADRAPWRAVLVGTATHLHPGLNSLPQVADNLLDLAAALTGPSGLLPEGSVRIVQDPPTAGHVLEAIGAPPDLIQSAVRFGLGRFTTQEEIDYAAGRVVEVVNKLRAESPV